MRSGLLILLLLTFFVCGCTGRKQQKLLQKVNTEISRNEYGRAVELLRKLTALDPQSDISIGALYKLGFILETYLKDTKGALFNYEEFILRSPDSMRAYEVQKRIAGIYYERVQNRERAIVEYQKLLLSNPKSLEADFFQFQISHL